MEKIVANYIVSKLITDVRNNVQINDNLALALDKYPHIDILRGEIGEKDAVYILKTIPNQSVMAGNMLISLLRNYSEQPAFKSWFIDHWYNTNDYNRRLTLLWRLLDDSSLELTMHEQLYKFVRENLVTFLDDTRDWLGGKEAMLEACKNRLSDPTFPRTKDWIYLCSATGSPDTEGAVSLLGEYKSSQGDFTAKVAGDLLDKLRKI